MEVCHPNTVDSYSSGEYIGLPANEIWRLCLPLLGKWHGVAGVHGQCGLYPLGHALEGGHDGGSSARMTAGMNLQSQPLSGEVLKENSLKMKAIKMT